MPTVEKILQLMHSSNQEDNSLQARELALQLTRAEILQEEMQSSVLLFKAAISGNFWLPVVQHMAPKVININQLYGRRQRTLLLAMCEQQPLNLPAIKVLFTETPEYILDINYPYTFQLPNGATALRNPLYFAVTNKSVECIQLLLDHGANLRCDEYNFMYLVKQQDVTLEYTVRGSILTVAALLGNAEGLTTLLQHPRMTVFLRHALLNQRILPTSGKTLLMLLVESNDAASYELCKIILSAGADPAIISNVGKTALDYARLADNEFAISILSPQEPLKKQKSIFSKFYPQRFLHVFQ